MSTMDCSPLERALQMGREMLAAAQARDWDEVASLHPAYEALLEKNSETQLTPATRDSLLQVWVQHQQLLDLTATARDAVARELDRSRHNHRALNTYLVHSQDD
ncbi:MAG TPA: flagellar protein FliT [Rhodanobacter sp.]|nr:flagellar protein FliT [Rhodanobacter sp.]